MEFVARARKPPKSHAFEAVVNLGVSEPHLHALTLVSRLEETLCPHEPSRHVTGVFMDVTGNLSRDHVWTTLHLQWTDIAVELRSAIAEHCALVHGPRGMQHLVGRADVDAASLVPAKVAA